MFADECCRIVPASAVGEPNMSASVSVPLLLACSLLTALYTGWSRDPNIRKQKYLDSGEKYAAEGKYREAAIQFRNASLRWGASTAASQEWTRSVELVPDNYRANTDLENLLDTVRNPDGSPVEDTLKQAKTHLDILRAKQPNNPETHEAWANYDAEIGR